MRNFVSESDDVLVTEGVDGEEDVEEDDPNQDENLKKCFLRQTRNPDIVNIVIERLIKL